MKSMRAVEHKVKPLGCLLVRTVCLGYSRRFSGRGLSYHLQPFTSPPTWSFQSEMTGIEFGIFFVKNRLSASEPQPLSKTSASGHIHSLHFTLGMNDERAKPEEVGLGGGILKEERDSVTLVAKEVLPSLTSTIRGNYVSHRCLNWIPDFPHRFPFLPLPSCTAVSRRLSNTSTISLKGTSMTRVASTGAIL